MALIERVSPTVMRIPLGYVNAYIVGSPEAWTLVDTGERRHAGAIRAAATAFAGEQPPRAIVLTHGHFDHAGSATELSAFWRVPVYASRYELPFLRREVAYPPPDPSVGGFYGWVANFVTMPECRFEADVQPLPADLTALGLVGWRCLATPGHTPGHISLFNEQQRLLIAGDACLTIDFQSWVGSITGWQTIAAPPAPYTLDWERTQASLQTLALLEPQILASGHGKPMRGPRVAAALKRLAARNVTPRRYQVHSYAGEWPQPGWCAKPGSHSNLSIYPQG